MHRKKNFSFQIIAKRGVKDCGLCTFHGEINPKQNHFCQFLLPSHERENCLKCIFYGLYQETDKMKIFINRKLEKMNIKEPKIVGNRCIRCLFCVKTRAYVKTSSEHKVKCFSCGCIPCCFLDLSKDLTNFKNRLVNKSEAEIEEWLDKNREPLEKILRELKDSNYQSFEIPPSALSLASIETQHYIPVRKTSITCPNCNINLGGPKLSTTESFSSSSEFAANSQLYQLVKSLI
jgi:hypothetical protein